MFLVEKDYWILVSQCFVWKNYKFLKLQKEFPMDELAVSEKQLHFIWDDDGSGDSPLAAEIY